MIILTLRTDKPEAEIDILQGSTSLASKTWHAHRQLAETIHVQIEQLLAGQGKKLSDVEAIVIFKGPGSFTGLRIGFSVANALAYSLEIPIVATSGKNWQQIGIKKLQDGVNDTICLPDYGAPARTTQQKK